MMIRAGNSNREMAASLGVNIPLLFALVFAVRHGAGGLCRLPSPRRSSRSFPGMGNQILIICFVVVVIGGIGSINGALIASLAHRLRRHPRQSARAGILRHRRLSFDGGDPLVAAPRACQQNVIAP